MARHTLSSLPLSPACSAHWERHFVSMAPLARCTPSSACCFVSAASWTADSTSFSLSWRAATTDWAASSAACLKAPTLACSCMEAATATASAAFERVRSRRAWSSSVCRASFSAAVVADSMGETSCCSRTIVLSIAPLFEAPALSTPSFFASSVVTVPSLEVALLMLSPMSRTSYVSVSSSLSSWAWASCTALNACVPACSASCTWETRMATSARSRWLVALMVLWCSLSAASTAPLSFGAAPSFASSTFSSLASSTWHALAARLALAMASRSSFCLATSA
mmetsp:Transcript_77266/g.202725  ORF Transcript_77266/g.202725 Transcript_77266/m.202725 type:complete len:281 (+) Transcript_77266:110-952(+)